MLQNPKYEGFNPASFNTPLNTGSCVFGVHAATTILLRLLSFIASLIFSAPVVVQREIFSSANLTFGNLREYSTSAVVSNILAIFIPHRQTKTPMPISSFSDMMITLKHESGSFSK